MGTIGTGTVIRNISDFTDSAEESKYPSAERPAFGTPIRGYNALPPKGPFTIQARKMILDRLLETEKGFGDKLISKEEIDIIESMWIDELLQKGNNKNGKSLFGRPLAVVNRQHLQQQAIAYAYWAFNQGLWSIGTNFEIVVACGKFTEQAPNQTGLVSYHSKQLDFSWLQPEHRPSQKNLDWHRRHRFIDQSNFAGNS